jgi:hypothetical protein
MVKTEMMNNNIHGYGAWKCLWIWMSTFVAVIKTMALKAFHPFQISFKGSGRRCIIPLPLSYTDIPKAITAKEL